MIWAWIGAAAVGLSLGLLGSGGAILTVPILVYLVGHDEKSAIAESLAIVGAIAMAGVIRAAMQNRVDFRSAALLAVPGIFGTYAGAHAANFIPGAVQLVLLSVLMLTAATLMFRSRPAQPALSMESSSAPAIPSRGPLWIIALQGIGLGIATGLVGVGGGFLIVPVLVLLRKLPMSTAIGTSLVIIAVNSTTGFLKYLSMLGDQAGPGSRALHVDWNIIGVFIAIGIAGSLMGNALAGRINQNTLKRIFAVFLVVMAGYILVRQAPRVMPGVFGPPASVAPNSAPNTEPDREPSHGFSPPKNVHFDLSPSPPGISPRGTRKEPQMTAIATTNPTSTKTTASTPPASVAFQAVTPAQLRQWLLTDEAVLIDVREPDEFAREHIAGATLLPLSRFDPAQALSKAKPGQRIVMQCKSGRRSADACRLAAPLAASGQPVFTLAGGIEAWKKDNLPVEFNTNVSGISVMRQVQLVIGLCVLAGSALAWFVDPRLVAIPAFFGAGLTFAGVSGTCALATIIGWMPWNKTAKSGASCTTGSCG